MELNYIIDGLIDGIKDIREHNHDGNDNEIYNDLDKQRELINKLIEFKKQIESDGYNMKADIQASIKEQSDNIKPKFIVLVKYDIKHIKDW